MGIDYFFNILAQNESAKVVIGLPVIGDAGATGQRESITAYIAEEVNIGGNSRYDTPGDDAFGQMWSAPNALLNQAGALAGAYSQLTGTSIINRQIKTIQSTISTWTSADKFNFSLPLRFYALDVSDDVRINVRRFLKCVYPIFDPQYPGMVQAPNAYDFTSKTCIAIKIGKWFRTPPLFLVTRTNWRISKETIKDSGTPLYAEGVVNFESFKMLSANEVSGFLISSAPTTDDFGNEIKS